MSKKITVRGNPNSNYGKLTTFMRKKQVYTKTDLVQHMMTFDKTHSQAMATVGVMLSPRLASTRGDCRGNGSNPWGHQAYNEKLARKVNKDTGKKDEQKWRFRFRSEELPIKGKATKTMQEKTPVAPVAAPVETVVDAPAATVDAPAAVAEDVATA